MAAVHPPRGVLRRSLASGLALGALAVAALAPAIVHAGLDPRPPARFARAVDSVAPAQSAAREWGGDVSLVHVENADTLAADGSSRAWTYFYTSPTRRMTRAFALFEGRVAATVDLPFAYDPLPIEEGWYDATAVLAAATVPRDPALDAVRARGGAAAAVLSRGLAAEKGGMATTWLFPARLESAPENTAAGPLALVDALQGGPLTLRSPGASGLATVSASNRTGPEVAAAALRGNAPGIGREEADDAMRRLSRVAPYFARHHAMFEARAAALTGALEARGRAATKRSRWLAAEEAEALARLAAIDGARDSLGRGELEAAGRGLEAELERLAHWRGQAAALDSSLARTAARITAAERDLATERNPELALFLQLEGRARPARLRVRVGDFEVGQASLGDAEWRALDAGGWSEVVRATVRPGTATVRVDVEFADRRTASVDWQGTFIDGRIHLLRLVLKGDVPSERGLLLTPLAGRTP